MPTLSPCVPIILSALIHHGKVTFPPDSAVNVKETHDKLKDQPQRRMHRHASSPTAGSPWIRPLKSWLRLPFSPPWRDVVVALILFAAPPHSVACLLRPLAAILRQWPRLLGTSSLHRIPRWVVGHTGPFGYGCGKVCEVLAAYALVTIRSRYASSESPWQAPRDVFQLGPMPSVQTMLAVLALSAAVNVVLSVWSRCHGKGDHDAVNKMVRQSVGRRLNTREHASLAAFAVANAICEEGLSRGFFYQELVSGGGLSHGQANVVQAAAFGLWHYHGIPSGATGVILTFAYGWIMGVVCEYGGGLLLPIIAHSVADYFIFAVVARQE